MIYFILGFLFAQVGLPLLDTLTSLIMTWLENFKSNLNVKITKNNYKVQTIAQGEVEDKHILGFIVPEEEENYDD